MGRGVGWGGGEYCSEGVSEQWLQRSVPYSLNLKLTASNKVYKMTVGSVIESKKLRSIEPAHEIMVLIT